MTTQIKVPIVVNMNMDEIIDRLKEDDFVQVVRCKDCKHWDGDDGDTFCSELGIFGTDPNSFCSYAKRKEE